MNEQELRRALRVTMTAAPERAPMNETPVLDAARRSVRRRRAGWAGAASAVAVAMIVAGAVYVAGEPGGSSAGMAGAGGGSAGGAGDTETSWPDGQTDRTATSGARHDQGVTLLDELAAVVPAGFGAPEDLRYEDPSYGGDPLRFHQAQYEDTVHGTQVWEYMAGLPVTKGAGVGELLVRVTTSGNRTVGEGCSLSPTMWGVGSTCEEHVVDGKRVGVFTGTGDADPESWAAYRYADGTVVILAQSSGFAGSGKPPLAADPLSADRLAQLAADPRFHLG